MSNKSLPYPVLGQSDDIMPGLDADCVKMSFPEKSVSEYKFSVQLCQNNNKISKLISEGKAEYACEINCSGTFFRRYICSCSPNFDITLNRKDVKGHIDFDFFVVATQSIPKYTNEGFNEDYKGFSFDLEKGDFLVQFGKINWNADIKYDKLYAAGSFMQIRDAGDNIDRIAFNLEEDVILIEMPHERFVQYQKIGRTCSDAIHSSIVHSALVYALCNMESYQGKGKRWVDCLEFKLNEMKVSVDEFQDVKRAFEIADELLQDPYKRMFDAFEKKYGEEAASDEVED